MDQYFSIEKYFEELFKDLNCESSTKAYIVSIFSKYKNSSEDLSKDSITLLFAQGRAKQDFYLFQKIGDWTLFYNVYNNQHNLNYYRIIGQLSYNHCYKLINKKWQLFEELSDNFEFLEKEVRKKMKRSSF